MLARRHGVTALAHTWISSCVDLTSAVSQQRPKSRHYARSVQCQFRANALHQKPPYGARRHKSRPHWVRYQMRGGAISPTDIHAELENSEMQNARATSQ